MGQGPDPRIELSGLRIEKIDLDRKSRDDIPALLLGLQHLWSDERTRARLFALLEEHVPPGAGRSGMEMWRILVMGVVMQGLGCGRDHLHELVNEHRTLREFLGHGGAMNDERYAYRTVADLVRLARPELLAGVGQLVVESGHAVARKKAWRAVARTR